MFQREFLGNTANKVRSIALLASHLEAAGCEVHHASADVDRLIVLTASDVADTFGISVLIGEDAYLLIMLTVLSDPDKHIHLVSYRPVMEAGKWTPYINPYTQRKPAPETLLHLITCGFCAKDIRLVSYRFRYSAILEKTATGFFGHFQDSSRIYSLNMSWKFQLVFLNVRVKV